MVASFPITLMVVTSLLQVFIMVETGALARIVVLIKTIAPRDQVIQIMIVNVGFGTLLAALGATPVSILPPIMLALGYSSFVAIALPALGYDALCTYALLGVPVVVFAGLVDKPVNEVGGYFARFMPVISTCIALGMLWMVGQVEAGLEGAGPGPALGPDGRAHRHRHERHPAGPADRRGRRAGRDAGHAGSTCWSCASRCATASVLTDADQAVEKRIPLWAALSPWLILTVFAVLVNLPSLPFYT